MNRGMIQSKPQSQSQSQPIHICFYSSKCEWSKAFLTEIAKLSYKNEFRFICVDPGPQRPQLPSWLKKVPTLVISGENEPRTDSDVMNWLYERKMKDGKTGLASAQGGLPQNGGGGGSGGGGDDLQPFMFGAMGGIYDDAYSSYDDTNIDSSNHGFSFLNGQDAVGTREAQNFGGGGSSSGRGDHRSQKEKLFDAQMEAYQRERNVGIPRMPSRQ
jgi:hypothetical protein